MNTSDLNLTTSKNGSSFIVVADSGRIWGDGNTSSTAANDAIDALYHAGVVSVFWNGETSDVESMYLDYMRKLYPDFQKSELPARRVPVA